MNTKAYIQLLCMMNTKAYVQLLCMMNTKAYIQLLCMMMKRTGNKLTDVTKVNTLYSPCVHLYIQLYYHSQTIHLLMSRYYSHGVTLV